MEHPVTIDWQRSTACSGGSCVEMAWVKSSVCASGTCVEVAEADGTVLMRDSKHPEQPPLAFSRAEWIAFLDAVQADEIDFGKD
jgi:hypothetical protein